MLLCSGYLGEPPISDFFSKKSEKVLAQPSRFPYSTSSLQGGVAQLGERLTGSQEVRGSIPLVSTTCFFLSLHGGVAQLGERLTGSQEVRGSIPLVSTMKDQVRAYALTFFVIKSSDWPVIKITGFSLLTTPQVTDCRKSPFSGPEMYDLALFRVLNVYVSFK